MSDCGVVLGGSATRGQLVWLDRCDDESSFRGRPRFGTLYSVQIHSRFRLRHCPHIGVAPSHIFLLSLHARHGFLFGCFLLPGEDDFPTMFATLGESLNGVGFVSCSFNLDRNL